MDEGTRFMVLAPVVRGRKGEYVDLFAELQAKGYARARVDGVVHPLTEPPKLKKQEKHTIEVVVDRLSVKAASKQRLTDSVESALGLAGGIVLLDFVDLPEDDPDRERRFSEHLACPNDHPLAIEDLEPRVFSFNAPYGACPECTGLGTKKEVDPELIVPDEERTLREGAIQPWSGGHDPGILPAPAGGARRGRAASTSTPRGGSCRRRAQKTILHGSDDQVHVRYRNKYGRERSYYTGFEGVVQWIERRHNDTESDWSARQVRGLHARRALPGLRRRPAQARGAGGDHRRQEHRRGLQPVGRRVRRAAAPRIELDDRQKMIAERVLKEINARLRFLLDVGLDYLSLDRGAGTLSGGEAQRIRLATQIGSGLVGVLYVLDEPSIGLHQRDNHRLIETLVRLRNLGNTLIVVEHDEDTIRTADWIVDIGPGAGRARRPDRAQRLGARPAGQRGVARPGPTCPAARRSRCRRTPAARRRRAASWSCRAPASTTCAT